MLYELMQTLGDTRRNLEDDGGMTVEEMKALCRAAFCSMLGQEM